MTEAMGRCETCKHWDNTTGSSIRYGFAVEPAGDCYELVSYERFRDDSGTIDPEPYRNYIADGCGTMDEMGAGPVHTECRFGCVLYEGRS